MYQSSSSVPEIRDRRTQNHVTKSRTCGASGKDFTSQRNFAAPAVRRSRIAAGHRASGAPPVGWGAPCGRGFSLVFAVVVTYAVTTRRRVGARKPVDPRVRGRLVVPLGCVSRRVRRTAPARHATSCPLLGLDTHTTLEPTYTRPSSPHTRARATHGAGGASIRLDPHVGSLDRSRSLHLRLTGSRARSGLRMRRHTPRGTPTLKCPLQRSSRDAHAHRKRTARCVPTS